MSHFTKVATKINSLPALFRALDALGLQYEVGSEAMPARVVGYMHEEISAVVGIRVPGTKYGIGIVRADDGETYELAGDWWGLETTTGRTEREIVDEIGRAYAVARVQIACEEAGYAFEGEPIVNQDGSTELVAVQWS